MDAFGHHGCITCDRRFASLGAACQHMDDHRHWGCAGYSSTSSPEQDSKKPVVNSVPKAVAQAVNKQLVNTRPAQHPADLSPLKEIPFVRLPVEKPPVAKQPVQNKPAEELPVAKQLINAQTVQHPAEDGPSKDIPKVMLPRTELPIAECPVEKHLEEKLAVENGVAGLYVSKEKSAEKQVVETHPASEEDQHRSDDSISSGIRVASGQVMFYVEYRFCSTRITDLFQQSTPGSEFAESEFDCPHCDDNFLKVSGVIDHLECGECVSEAFRYESLYEFLAAVDSDCVFTNAQMDEGPVPKQCRHGESDTWGLPNQRTEFSVRQQTLYHCPDALDCNMGFNTLAAVFRHLENEECGHMEYDNVQGKMRKILGVFSACNGR